LPIAAEPVVVIPANVQTSQPAGIIRWSARQFSDVAKRRSVSAEQAVPIFSRPAVGVALWWREQHY